MRSVVCGLSRWYGFVGGLWCWLFVAVQPGGGDPMISGLGASFRFLLRGACPQDKNGIIMRRWRSVFPNGMLDVLTS